MSSDTPVPAPLQAAEFVVHVQRILAAAGR